MDSLLELIRARRAELEATAALGRNDEEAQHLEGSFIDFVEAAWPAIDPAEYQPCWAIDWRPFKRIGPTTRCGPA